MKRYLSHEPFASDNDPPLGSSRSFGIVMAAFLALLAIVNWWSSGAAWFWIALVACVVLLTAAFRPAALQPLNRVWFRIGLLLHAVVSPLVMALIFFAVIWPTGMVMRLRGKPLLKLDRVPGDASYWIVRDPAGPRPETMKDQF